MNEESYYSKLIKHYPEKKRYFEWIKYELDGRIYYYGEHFKYPYEDSRMIRKVHDTMSAFKEIILGKRNTVVNNYNCCILSEAYFTVNEYLSQTAGVKVYAFPWHEGVDVFAKKEMRQIVNHMLKLPFNQLISDAYCKKLDLLYEAIKEFVKGNNVSLVVFPNDLSAIHRIAIDACKDAGVVTAIFLHGLPGRYNNIDDNRADYLCVWGDSIKNQYEKQGVDPQKIIVTGHPNYSKRSFPKVKEPTLDAPLVLSNSVNGQPSSSDNYLLSDRGISVSYAWTVEKALKSIGCKHAVLRLHPSERLEWYSRFVDMDFYTLDTHSLVESLKESTLVIGPMSTVSMDAASNGIPYFCYNQEMKYSSPLVAPFDGSEEDFPVALSIDELVENLRFGRCMKPSIFNNYIARDFDLSDLISKTKM